MSLLVALVHCLGQNASFFGHHAHLQADWRKESAPRVEFLKRVKPLGPRAPPQNLFEEKVRRPPWGPVLFREQIAARAALPPRRPGFRVFAKLKLRPSASFWYQSRLFTHRLCRVTSSFSRGPDSEIFRKFSKKYHFCKFSKKSKIGGAVHIFNVARTRTWFWTRRKHRDAGSIATGPAGSIATRQKRRDGGAGAGSIATQPFGDLARLWCSHF